MSERSEMTFRQETGFTFGQPGVLLFFLFLFPAVAAGSGGQPNIIIILADDLGTGDLGMNGSVIRTPHIDGMASEGAVLTDFYTSANVCTPSRAGLLTGRYPIRTGLAQGVIEPESIHGLPEEETTLAEYLQEKGYDTALIGKWHLGHTARFWPTRHGFDYFYGLPYSNDMQPLALYRNETPVAEQVDQDTLTAGYTEETLAFIEQHRGGPFFIFLAHTFPHIPLHASASFRGKSRAGIYGDSVEELDWSTGRVLAALRDHDLHRKTLVFFTSDNGAWFEGSNAGARGMKGLSWDGGYRVPLIAWWPGMIAPGTVSRGIAMNIDLFPTIAAILGPDADKDRRFDGSNIWPLLQGSQKSPHDFLLLFNNEDIASIRTQEWKYITHAYYRSRYLGFERVKDVLGFDYQLLYRMQGNTGEHYSMSANEPRVLVRMQELMQTARAEFDVLRSGPPERTYP